MHDIASKLLASRIGWDTPPAQGVGVYAVYLKAGRTLASITAAPNGLLYIGMTDECFTVRDHFRHPHSGRSSPRRTLGAVLRKTLGLRAIPRGGEADSKRFINYRFRDIDEQRLSDWMAKELKVGRAPITDDIKTKEKALIRLLEPPLNLTNWKNPQRPHLKKLRRDCADQARMVAL